MAEINRGFTETLEEARLGLTKNERVAQLREAIDNLEVGESIDKAQEYLAEQLEAAREYARENPKTVIGSAAGVLVGASLLASAMRRGSGSKKKSGGSKKSSGSKKSGSRT